MNIDKVNSKVLLIAIYLYLDDYFDQGSEELGAFLSSLSPIVDGSPADPALYEDWCKIINNKENLAKEEAYYYMFEFLKVQNNKGWSEIDQFITQKHLNVFNKQIIIKQFVRWDNAINKALKYDIHY